MKRLLLSAILLVVLIPVYGQKKAYDRMLRGIYAETVPTIKVDSAVKVAEGNTALFLDTRSSREYEVSHIQGAQFVDYDAFDMSQLVDLPRDTAIVVYCSVGYRSERIGEQLLEAGFTNVSNLYGGIFSWKNQHQTVVNINDHPTDSVHAYDRLWGIWLDEGIKVYGKK
ncbi:MAG: rhodanese-like domain-containing protein [Bacteroidota bacterium]